MGLTVPETPYFTVGTMSKLSLKQAAEFAGVTKPTILKHIASGKVSGERDQDGRWWFDLSELRRAYGEPESGTGSGNGSGNREVNSPTPPGLQSETPVSDALIAELRERIEELRADKADLRQRLDERERVGRETENRLLSVIEKQAEQVKLLTDQRVQEPQITAAPEPPKRRGLMTRLLGGMGRE